ncbi:MAG: hypothetical protein NkDv07_0529 [Candidatus Improbicoccus devescovinae]|nr:MAG: hypothetical protein NkDv07_0495 [Candidatus Improbicoccus devescovinae]GMB10651.1 MAG: hypothetical protein NkDv07_0529 [Candidatus Improbicoccus devescovinae]
MTDKQFEREKNYQISILLIKSMLKNSVISKKDFDVVNDKLIKKYKPIFGELNHLKNRIKP